MRNALLLCFLLTVTVPHAIAQQAVTAIASADIRYGGGDGLTIKKAIVVTGAKTASEGEAAEEEWVRTNLPGARIVSRGRVTGPPHYDVITVEKAAGGRIDIHFDITVFFGK